MSLRGNLRTMDLPDILQWIATGQKTGTLHLERRSIQKRIIFREGIIFSSWSNDPRESLGQFLIRDRLVTEEQLFKRAPRAGGEGPAAGLDPGRRRRPRARTTCGAPCKAKAEETIYDLFLWPEGQFEFKEGEFPDDILIHVRDRRHARDPGGHPPGRRVAADPRRSSRAWRPPSRCKGAAAAGRGRRREAVLGLAAAGKTLAEISLELRRSRVRGGRAALRAARPRRSSWSDEVRAGEPGRGPGGRDPGAARARLPAAAGEALRRGAQGLRGGAGARPPQPERQEGPDRRRWRRASRERALQTVPLDKVPVLTMDLADADPAELRSPGGLRALPRQRPVGRAVDPEALPDGRRGRAPDLRPPPRPQGHRARPAADSSSDECERQSATPPRTLERGCRGR